MNDKDQKLLSILKHNARISVSDLARQLGVSRTTIQQRLNRLEHNGTITGYTVKLGDSVSKSRITAHSNLMIEPNANRDVVNALENISEIETLFTVSGKIDLIAIINVDSSIELDKTLDKISAVPGIRSTETAIVLTTKFDRK